MGQAQSNHSSKRKRSDTQVSEQGYAPTTSYLIAAILVHKYDIYAVWKFLFNLSTHIQFDEKRCEEWYMRYADPEMPDTILPEGTQQFFEDMDIPMDDVAVIAIAWKMNVATMGYITKDEWMNSMRKFGTDSMDKLKQKRAELQESIQNPEQLKEMYNYTFGYAKNREQKCMDVDVAIILLTLILADKYPIVSEFVKFLQVSDSGILKGKLTIGKEKQPVRVINRDQWRSFYDFVSIVSSDLSDYDETSAWPVLFDEFVEWRRGCQ
ncbi:hypothetical protein EC973_002928 [Apophysomyces ossiformis]|uniref:Defective in cullin neddylation protein n=1 Tax=Apophysomyces ossiformis TaxID=679940 RepID=A0A8H7BRW4_9FUNG|nr:hypothetical protein EC973_002928 [Apophysomyces ossiformis]